MNEAKKILMEFAEKIIDKYVEVREEQGDHIEVTAENADLHLALAWAMANDRYKKVSVHFYA